jgi:hypothetical protein
LGGFEALIPISLIQMLSKRKFRILGAEDLPNSSAVSELAAKLLSGISRGRFFKSENVVHHTFYFSF